MPDLPEITDDDMRSVLQTAKAYTVVLLKAGPNDHAPDRQQIQWEHARRNFALRAAGHLAVVVRVVDDSGVLGVGVFTTPPDETARIMDEDPGVEAGVFVYEIHPGMSFPGDALS